MAYTIFPREVPFRCLSHQNARQLTSIAVLVFRKVPFLCTFSLFRTRSRRQVKVNGHRLR